MCQSQEEKKQRLESERKAQQLIWTRTGINIIQKLMEINQIVNIPVELQQLIDQLKKQNEINIIQSVLEKKKTIFF